LSHLRGRFEEHVEGPKLMEGDKTGVHVVGEQAFDMVRDHALKRIRAFRKTLPADWKFDRDEANSRESLRFSG
jgi:antitoxin MazE